MLEYFDKEKFDEYVNGLKRAILDGTWPKYMRSNKDPKVYFKSSYVPDYFNKELSSPYYSEISIDLVSSCNTSSARKEIPSNFERVIGAVQYILENKCMPIALIKHGDEFYIENGKHRFYAYILLNKKTIPVSIREVVAEKIDKNMSMISINRPFYNNDGMNIAYPEKALEFFEIYKVLFESIRSVEMITNDEPAKSVLRFYLYGGDFIEFLDCCTAGNDFRSSQVTCEILIQCGYQIDMNYIKNNSNFKLEDKRDAHNLVFESDKKDDIIEKYILPNIDKLEPYDRDKTLESEFYKLHSYVSWHKPFDVPGANFSWYSSCYLEVDDKNIFLVGSENANSIDSIYIFKDSYFPFKSTTVEFCGIILSSDSIYKKICRLPL